MSEAFHDWLEECPVNWTKMSEGEPCSHQIEKEAYYNFWEDE